MAASLGPATRASGNRCSRFVETFDQREASAVVGRPSVDGNLFFQATLQSMKVPPDAVQLRDLLLDLGQITGDDLHDMLARRRSFIANRQDAANIGERHAQGFRAGDKVEPVDCLGSVQAVTRWSAACRLDESNRVVVAKSFWLHPSQGTKPANGEHGAFYSCLLPG